MANYEEALKITLNYEGYYAKVPGDKGGETYRGISRVDHPDWTGWAIIDKHQPLKYNQEVKDDQVTTLVSDFYRVHYWNRLLCDNITSQRIASMLFDWNVNSGSPAVTHLKNITGRPAFGGVTQEDINAVNASNEVNTFTAYKAARVKFYNDIVKSHPQYDKFKDGWLRRAESFN